MIPETAIPSTLGQNGLRALPQDLAAEAALLGSIFLSPDGLKEIADRVRIDDFYAEKHRVIFRAMLELSDRGDPVDALAVTAMLRDQKLLERAGGTIYTAELINTVPSASNIVYYADIVRRKAALRNLIASAESIMSLGYEEDKEVETLFDKAEKIIFSITNFAKKTFIAIKDALPEAWERFDRLHKSSGALRGVPTGFRDLDNLLAGLQNSDLVILAARPSMGKTSLALDVVRHVAVKSKIPVGVFSMEMSSQQLIERILAAESRVDAWKLRTGKLSTDEEFERLQDALHSLSEAPIFIDDEPANNISKMRAVARRLKSEYNLGLVVVDYLQLMNTTKNYDSMVNQVTEISRSLKGLARELDIPVLALSQLSRAVESRGGKPRLSDLRDSGSIEQDADVVMFIHREDKYRDDSDRKNVAEIMVEKHRNGPVGKVELYFDDKRVSFSTIEKGDFGSF